MSQELLLWIFGIFFTLGQVAFLFLWNNTRADAASNKKETAKRLEKIENDIDLKVNIVDSVESRVSIRADLKELFTADGKVLVELNNMERRFNENLSQLERRILDQIERCHPRSSRSR